MVKLLTKTHSQFNRFPPPTNSSLSPFLLEFMEIVNMKSESKTMLKMPNVTGLLCCPLVPPAHSQHITQRFKSRTSSHTEPKTFTASFPHDIYSPWGQNCELREHTAG